MGLEEPARSLSLTGAHTPLDGRRRPGDGGGSCFVLGRSDDRVGRGGMAAKLQGQEGCTTTVIRRTVFNFTDKKHIDMNNIDKHVEDTTRILLINITTVVAVWV